VAIAGIFLRLSDCQEDVIKSPVLAGLFGVWLCVYAAFFCASWPVSSGEHAT